MTITNRTFNTQTFGRKMNFQKTLILGTLLLLSAGCGGALGENSSGLTPNEVAGTWYSENETMTSDKCNAAATLKATNIGTIDNDDSYFRIVGSPDNIEDPKNIEFFECTDSTCSQKNTFGVYTFRDSLSVNPKPIEVSLSPKVDCKLLLNFSFTVTFDDASNGNAVTVLSFETEGSKCEAVERALLEASNPDVKALGKLITDETCTYETEMKFIRQ